MALRYDNWKLVFMEQRMVGTLRIWQEPLVPLRFPKLFNLRTDPFERADITSNTYWDWVLDHVYLLLPAQKYRGRIPDDVQGVSRRARRRRASPSTRCCRSSWGVPSN